MIVRFNAINLHDDTFDLGGEHINAANDEHIVTATLDSPHTDDGPPATARFRIQNGDIAGSVADDWKCLLGDGGENQLPWSTIGQDLFSVRIDNFRNKMVLEDVQPILGFDAFHRNSRTYNFTEAINIHGLYVQLPFNLLPHLLGPGFGPENAGLEVEFAKIHPHFLGHLGNQQSIRGCAGEDCGAKIRHDHHLPLGVAP